MADPMIREALSEADDVAGCHSASKRTFEQPHSRFSANGIIQQGWNSD